jgi:drug/metabolite transporter (DMT)-like permease
MLAFLGFVQIGLGYLLFTYGQRRIPALEGALLSMLEPILNPIWVLLWYGEKPSSWAVAGGAIILISLGVRMIYLKNLKVPISTS